MKKKNYHTPETEIVSTLIKHTILDNSPLQEKLTEEEEVTNVELGANESSSFWDEE